MWNERVCYSLSRMLITGEDVERESGLLSEQDVNHRRKCGTREWVTFCQDINYGTECGTRVG